MQGRLAVKEDYITIGKLPVDLPADIDLLGNLLAVLIGYLDASLVRPGNIIHTRMAIRAAAHECLHDLHIPGVGNHGH
jgi:hypothetical protein